MHPSGGCLPDWSIVSDGPGGRIESLEKIVMSTVTQNLFTIRTMSTAFCLAFLIALGGCKKDDGGSDGSDASDAADVTATTDPSDASDSTTTGRIGA